MNPQISQISQISQIAQIGRMGRMARKEGHGNARMYGIKSWADLVGLGPKPRPGTGIDTLWRPCSCRVDGGITMLKINRTSVLAGLVALPALCTSVRADVGCGDSSLFTVDNRLAIPTVSEWGLMVMALLVVTAGTLVWMRREPATA